MARNNNDGSVAERARLHTSRVLATKGRYDSKRDGHLPAGDPALSRAPCRAEKPVVGKPFKMMSTEADFALSTRYPVCESELNADGRPTQSYHDRVKRAEAQWEKDNVGHFAAVAVRQPPLVEALDVELNPDGHPTQRYFDRAKQETGDWWTGYRRNGYR